MVASRTPLHDNKHLSDVSDDIDEFARSDNSENVPLDISSSDKEETNVIRIQEREIITKRNILDHNEKIKYNLDYYSSDLDENYDNSENVVEERRTTTDNDDDDDDDDENMYNGSAEDIGTFEHHCIKEILDFLKEYNYNDVGLEYPRMTIDSVFNVIAFLFEQVSPLPRRFVQDYEKGYNRIAELMTALQVPISPLTGIALDHSLRFVNPSAVKYVINDIYAMLQTVREIIATRSDTDNFSIDQFELDPSLTPLRNREAYIRQYTAIAYSHIDHDNISTELGSDHEIVADLLPGINRTVEAFDMEARKHVRLKDEEVRAVNIEIDTLKKQIIQYSNAQKQLIEDVPVALGKLCKNESEIKSIANKCTSIRSELGNNGSIHFKMINAKAAHSHVTSSSEALTRAVEPACAAVGMSVNDVCEKAWNLPKISEERDNQRTVIALQRAELEEKHMRLLRQTYTQLVTVLGRYNTRLEDGFDDFFKGLDVNSLRLGARLDVSLEELMSMSLPLIQDSERATVFANLDSIEEKTQELRSQWNNLTARLSAKEASLRAAANELEQVTERRITQLDSIVYDCKSLQKENQELEAHVTSSEKRLHENQKALRDLERNFTNLQLTREKSTSLLKELQMFTSKHNSDIEKMLHESHDFYRCYKRHRSRNNAFKNRLKTLHGRFSEFAKVTNKIADSLPGDDDMEKCPENTLEAHIWIDNAIKRYAAQNKNNNNTAKTIVRKST